MQNAFSTFKGSVCYIFFSLFCITKQEHLQNKEKGFFISPRMKKRKKTTENNI